MLSISSKSRKMVEEKMQVYAEHLENFKIKLSEFLF